ncbi:class I SAM-dependent methyltransferase [bacterium SCSIO 12643]|nr:class I SAM-dependent methyltransferase [bacterium SCSIO 12643]
MRPDFDHIAGRYDSDFTKTAIGVAQRDLVYDALEKEFSKIQGWNVLELNCGTGEDAKYLAEKGGNVLATDISRSMVEVARSKTESYANVKCEVLDINDIQNQLQDDLYDLVFSNFGGLNCLSPKELQSFFKSIHNKLKSGGHLVLVVMTNKCLWESLYFLGKLKWSAAFRRSQKEGVWAHVEGQQVKTYYYAPQELSQMAKGFETIQISPIGFYVPPSYLNPMFQNRPKLLDRMRAADKKSQYSIGKAAFSDHFLIHLIKK